MRMSARCACSCSGPGAIRGCGGLTHRVLRALERSGDPAHEIVAYAKEQQSGLLVLGTRGHTGLRRLMLGSVARNVLLHAPCSVLVVRENVAPPADGDALIHAAMSER